MHTVVVNPPELNLHADLHSKLYEIRIKRDAVDLHHESLKKQTDWFNKCIIILSLFTAFVETLKTTLNLTDAAEHGYVLSSLAKIAPIGLSTITAVISSLMKFRKFPERMEDLTKASEKFSHCVKRIRRLQEELNFLPEDDCKRVYIEEIMEFYREALQQVESKIYPDIRMKYYKRALEIITKMDDFMDNAPPSIVTVEITE
jgi:hypothetical protein